MIEYGVAEDNGDELLYRQECYELLGACFAVYKDKGCGFLEAVYQEFNFGHYPQLEYERIVATQGRYTVHP